MPVSRSPFLPVLAIGAAGVVMLAPGRASAHKPHVFSPGFTLSISFGDKVAFGIGADARYTYLIAGSASDCEFNKRGGLGAFASAAVLVSHGVGGRFALGAHGGGELTDQHTYGLDGEVGWTYRTKLDDSPGAHGILFGAHNIVAALGDFGLQGAWSFPESGFRFEGIGSAAIRYGGPFGLPISCTIGRPLRGADGFVIGDAFEASPGSALAREWVEGARTEAASIPAFLALARDLTRMHAPRELVARALEAAEDEARHAAICCALARHAGVEAVVEVPAVPPPSGLDARHEIARLLAESWIDGVIGEGGAAARAREAAATAVDPVVRRALASIAVDEQRHADLGRDIVRWCLRVGGREALAGARKLAA